MRRSIHRGVVALAIVTSLSVAGAHPAAAMDLGSVGRQLSSLWSFITGASPAQHRTEGRTTKPGRKAQDSNTDRGWGIDPNGNSLTTAPVPGTASTGG